MTFLTKAREVVWGKRPDTELERRLLVKIDFYILTFVCLVSPATILLLFAELLPALLGQLS